MRSASLLVAHAIPPLYPGYTDLVVPLSGWAALATLACWAVSISAVPRRIGFGPGFLRWPAAALLAFVWASAFASIDPTISIFASLQVTIMAGIALYALNEVDSLGRLLVPISAMIAIEAVVGVAQVATQGSLGLGVLGELRLDPADHGASVVGSAAGGRLLRAYGLSDHPNILGGLVVLGLPILGLGGMDGGGRWRLVVGVVLGLAAVTIVLTFSRAAWLAAVVEVAVALVMLIVGGNREIARRWGAAVAAAALLGGVAALPYTSFVTERADLAGVRSATEAMSTGERVILAEDAIGIAAAHPLTGTGIGTFPLALSQVAPSLTFDYQPAPVVPLDVAAEAGLPAGIAYAVILIAPWLALARRRVRWTAEVVAASGALAALAVLGFLDYYTWTFTAGRIWAWLVLGLWGAAYVRAAIPRTLATASETSDRHVVGPAAEAHA